MSDAGDRAFLLKIAEDWRKLAERDLQHTGKPGDRTRPSHPRLLGIG
ncbi:MAG: hypothetical protein JO124_07500 [Hyphomicrobiales bacterium]|nr:hypothetical protein [Hyphomicrobiales bacterium]MBV9977254.1 hypothetical protein [Hyphomicrobiales bacterium]